MCAPLHIHDRRYWRPRRFSSPPLLRCEIYEQPILASGPLGQRPRDRTHASRTWPPCKDDVAVLAQGTAAQPLGVFGNWPPNWYVNAIAMAEHLRAEHRVRDLLRALAHLLRSRNDDHYMQYVEAPMADFLPALGGDHYPTGALPILHDYVMQWGRYVEGWLFEEYMNVWFPHQQLRLRQMEGEGPGSLVHLPALQSQAQYAGGDCSAAWPLPPWTKPRC